MAVAVPIVVRRRRGEVFVDQAPTVRPVESTWLSRDVPILEAVALAEVEGTNPDSWWIGERTGVTPKEVAFGIRALIDGDYLSAVDAGGSVNDRTSNYLDVQLRERGRRSVGLWPKEGDGVEVLLDVLAERIDAETDPETRSKLTKLRDAALGVGKDVGTSVLTAFVKSVAGLP